MIAVVCVDDKGGMLFNKRRQSSDAALIDDLVRLAGDRKIIIGKFSEALFANYSNKTVIADDFLQSAKEDDLCFIENIDLLLLSDSIKGLIVYHWNRVYPSDMKFGIKLSDYRMVGSFEFVGCSHEKITREEYVK